tara:strand:+ start:30 stop:464 length:435 start_codon:yes stop_codon:yes gene_type:complete
MKISKETLKKIIKEEIQSTLEGMNVHATDQYDWAIQKGYADDPRPNPEGEKRSVPETSLGALKDIPDQLREVPVLLKEKNYSAVGEQLRHIMGQMEGLGVDPEIDKIREIMGLLSKRYFASATTVLEGVINRIEAIVNPGESSN